MAKKHHLPPQQVHKKKTHKQRTPPQFMTRQPTGPGVGPTPATQQQMLLAALAKQGGGGGFSGNGGGGMPPMGGY